MSGIYYRETVAKALEIISQHGDNAERIAAESYVNCFYDGELLQAVTWKAVRKVIREIQVAERPSGSWMH